MLAVPRRTFGKLMHAAKIRMISNKEAPNAVSRQASRTWLRKQGRAVRRSLQNIGWEPGYIDCCSGTDNV